MKIKTTGTDLFYTLISIISVMSPILKNSPLHVYLFRSINIDPKRINEDNYKSVHINVPKVKFRPKMVIFLNGLNSDLAFFAPHPCLFQPSRLLEG